MLSKNFFSHFFFCRRNAGVVRLSSQFASCVVLFCNSSFSKKNPFFYFLNIFILWSSAVENTLAEFPSRTKNFYSFKVFFILITFLSWFPLITKEGFIIFDTNRLIPLTQQILPQPLLILRSWIRIDVNITLRPSSDERFWRAILR